MKYRNIDKKMIETIVHDLSNHAWVVTSELLDRFSNNDPKSCVKNTFDNKTADVLIEYHREFERFINKKIYNEKLLFDDVKEIIEELKK